MIRRWPFALAVAAAALILHVDLNAADKKTKEPDKKKAEPAKPVIVQGELANTDVKDRVYTQSFCKTFTFKMEKDKAYQFLLATNAFRACIRIEDLTGGQLASDFDRLGRNTGAEVVYRSTKTADHQIVVTAINANAVGKFTLTVKELTGDFGKPIDLKLDKGQGTFTGNIDKTDIRYNGKIHKLFIVKMEAGKTYQIDHVSRNFDAYLYLQGPDGNVLAQDDDGGEGLNSRIIHKAAKAGEYRIVATSLGGASTGQFTFTVTEKK